MILQTTALNATQVPFPPEHEKKSLTRAGARDRLIRSREPGAGSREPGAGSREPGAGSRLYRSASSCPPGCSMPRLKPSGCRRPPESSPAAPRGRGASLRTCFLRRLPAALALLLLAALAAPAQAATLVSNIGQSVDETSQIGTEFDFSQGFTNRHRRRRPDQHRNQAPGGNCPDPPDRDSAQRHCDIGRGRNVERPGGDRWHHHRELHVHRAGEHDARRLDDLLRGARGWRLYRECPAHQFRQRGQRRRDGLERREQLRLADGLVNRWLHRFGRGPHDPSQRHRDHPSPRRRRAGQHARAVRYLVLDGGAK